MAESLDARVLRLERLVKPSLVRTAHSGDRSETEAAPGTVGDRVSENAPKPPVDYLFGAFRS